MATSWRDFAFAAVPCVDVKANALRRTYVGHRSPNPKSGQGQCFLMVMKQIDGDTEDAAFVSDVG
jgi:hypothetical protein